MAFRRARSNSPGRAGAAYAVLLACSLLTSSSIATANTGGDLSTFKITGVVLNERNGAPVPNCHLTATRKTAGAAPQRSRAQQRNQFGGESPSADTDVSGHFSLSVPSAGNWQVYAYGRNFRQQAYDRHENFFTAVVLTDAAPTYDMLFRLEPDSAISGFVLDEAGDGVRNARVSLRAAESQNPDLADGIGSIRSGTATDDRGHYEFAGLAPGDYIVGVQAEPWYAAAAGTRRGNGAQTDPQLDVVYPQTWFPGVQDLRSAERIGLHDGEDREADFNLTPAPASHLRISAPPTIAGAQRGQIFPSVERIAGDGVPFSNTSVQIDPQGQIDVGGLSPGLYRVTLQGAGGPQPPTFIRVPSGAVRNLDLSGAIPIASLTLHLQLDGEAERVQVVLTDVETGATFFSYAPGTGRRGQGTLQRRVQAEAALKPDGDRKLELPPARYRVTLVGDGDVYLSGLSIKSTPVQGRMVTLASGSTTLNLQLTRGRASVRGIASLSGKPSVGAMTMLVPATFGQPGSITILRRDQTNTDGSFLIENIIPGDYILLAIDHGWSVNWRDPATLAQFLTRGVPITLQPNASVVQQLTAQTP